GSPIFSKPPCTLARLVLQFWEPALIVRVARTYKDDTQEVLERRYPMAQSWRYMTLTLNKNQQVNWYVELQDGDDRDGTDVSHEACKVMKGMGEAGWDLVTSINFRGDGRPNLVFKKLLERSQEPQC